MGFDEGQIILDSDNGAYYSGQTVYGRIVFDQDEVKTIHGIYVDVIGFCEVRWSNRHSRRANNRQETYFVNHESYEEYFRKKTFIFGDSSDEHHLQPGHHEFTFDCPIPAICPSSFEGIHGRIRYRLKVVMVTSGIFSTNKDKTVALTVLAPVDLNQIPYCKEPIQYELLSSYCCWCVSAGSSEILVKLPVGGYCPGQVIPIEVFCKNPSRVEIDELKFAIKRDVIYTSKSNIGKRKEHNTIAEIKKGPIPAGTVRNWTVEMEVPAMDVYNVNACRFIDINYYFKVSTEVSGCHEDSEETHPIIFGTIPLAGFQDNVQNPLQDQLPNPMHVQNVQGANVYPPPPIINQPLPNSPYPSANLPYPNNSPYPAGNPGYPTTPILGQNQPYSPGNKPYGPGNPPYPNVTVNPYPPSPNFSANNLPYPPSNATNSPYPPGNAPYPQESSPYPTDRSPHGVPSPVPYPVGRRSPVPPYPSVSPTPPLKTGTIGLLASSGNDPARAPLLPPGANVPYPTSPPNPYATASAPEPSTPGVSSPYNPGFMTYDKKDEKTN